MEKLYSSKTCLKMAGGRMHPVHPPPGSALVCKTTVWEVIAKKRITEKA